jgi:hypothetical protein
MKSLEAMSMAHAKENADTGIRFNVLQPGRTMGDKLLPESKGNLTISLREPKHMKKGLLVLTFCMMRRVTCRVDSSCVLVPSGDPRYRRVEWRDYQCGS